MIIVAKMEGTMQFNKILVTGCGGDIGLGIGKILKTTGMARQIIGTDISDDHAGSSTFDKCIVVERADSSSYLDSLAEVIRKFEIDIVVPMSEMEIRVLYANHLIEIDKVPLVMANPKSLEIGLDKLLTADLLKSNGLPYPWTKIVNEGPPQETPCIIKSRFGSGSKDIGIVQKDLVDYYSLNQPDSVWQEYLQPDDQEYTCGLYRTKTNEIHTIIIKRRLGGGHTVAGEVIKHSEIEQVLIRIAELLELRGSINVQLRLTERGPVVFEINPRFSSTIVFRHLLGFQDLIWALTEAGGESIESYKPPLPGTRFYRISDEIIIPSR